MEISKHDVMKNCLILLYVLSFPFLLVGQQPEGGPSLLEEVQHAYADNEGVKLHYVRTGQGPLVVMLHGFPDYWYSWRAQMLALRPYFEVVAMDLRGYNLSDQPQEVEAYRMEYLLQDVMAVIRACGREKAIVVGHDWGGAIAWQLAIQHPEVVEKLIVCNMTHPTGYSKAALQLFRQNGNTSYIDMLQNVAPENIPPARLYGWVSDTAARKEYAKAFARSSVEGMLNYYRANMPTKEERARWLENPVIEQLPPVKMPVHMIFGTQDQYVPKAGLNDSWDYVGGELSLLTLPQAGHFVQHDAAELVSNSMLMWLLRDRKSSGQLAGLSWLCGKWTMKGEQQQLVEEWRQSSAEVLRGRSYRISGGDTTLLEQMLITHLGDQLYYLPLPHKQEFPPAFQLSASRYGEFIFERPQHDFPQRISYKLLDRSHLRATIETLGGEKRQVFEFIKE